MSSPVFELMPQSKVRIEDKILSIHCCDPPLNGKYKYVMDGTSDVRDKICQHIFVHDFMSVFPTDLPNGFSLTIQNPRSDFRNINFVEIKKLDDSSKLVVILNFIFSDWHLPLNLPHFAEAYCESLKENVENATESYVESDELIGVFVYCGVSVSPTTSFFSAYRKTEAQILTTYRKCLADVYKPPTQLHDTKQSQSADVSGAKWWVKYVIVPVLGSGAVAAIAAGLMAFLK